MDSQDFLIIKQHIQMNNQHRQMWQDAQKNKIYDTEKKKKKKERR